MAMVKRHWRLALLLNALLLAAAGGVLVHQLGGGAVQASMAQPEAEQRAALDLHTYSQISVLRQRLCLTNHDLAAMGCGAEQAESVLEGLLKWYETNQAAMEQAERSELAARRELEGVMRGVNTGPRDEVALVRVAGLRDSHGRALAHRVELEESAVAHLPLDGNQRQLRQEAVKNAGRAERYRYVGQLTDAEAARLESALLRHGTGSRQLREAEDAVLFGARQWNRESALANQRQHLGGVLAAEAKVLPLPEELSSEFLTAQTSESQEQWQQ